MRIFVKSFLPLFAALATCSLASPAAENKSVSTLTLAEARKLALKNHPQVAAANYRFMAAEEVVKEARAGFFPSAGLFGTASGADADGERITAGSMTSSRVYNKVAGGLGVSQLLTDFGRTANLAASSKYSADAAGENAAATREQVLLQVDQTYSGALEAQAVLRVAQQTLDTRQLLLEQVVTLASNQLKSELDVSFAQVAVEQARLLLQRSQNDADAAMAALSTALGNQEFQSYQLVEPSAEPNLPTNDVSELVAEALRDRPELASLRDERDSAASFARAQKYSRLPSVSAVGAVGAAPLRSSALQENYAVGAVELSMPLFAGGLYLARQHEAERRAQASAETLRALEDIVVRDVRIAWLNLNSARQQLRTTEQLARQAGEAYDLAQARYKAGSSSIVELSQAQLDLISAQIANTNARYDVLIEEANLMYQIGGQMRSERTQVFQNKKTPFTN